MVLTLCAHDLGLGTVWIGGQVLTIGRTVSSKGVTAVSSKVRPRFTGSGIIVSLDSGHWAKACLTAEHQTSLERGWGAKQGQHLLHPAGSNARAHSLTRLNALPLGVYMADTPKFIFRTGGGWHLDGSAHLILGLASRVPRGYGWFSI